VIEELAARNPDFNPVMIRYFCGIGLEKSKGETRKSDEKTENTDQDKSSCSEFELNRKCAMECRAFL
jgi:hypothetical protein